MPTNAQLRTLYEKHWGNIAHLTDDDLRRLWSREPQDIREAYLTEIGKHDRTSSDAAVDVHAAKPRKRTD